MTDDRRFRLLGVGTGKSGTHSIDGLFAKHYRSIHEPEAHTLVQLVVDRNDGKIGDEVIVDYLADRERRLRLEANVGLNGWVVHLLAELDPAFCYLLSIRHPRAWLQSITDHTLNHDTPDVYLRMREQFFATGEPHPTEEGALADRGLYTVDGYLRYWRWHNQRVFDVVDPDRLLVVPTHRIDVMVEDVAAFVGVDPSTLDLDRGPQFSAPEHHGVLDDLDPAYVEDRLDAWCRDLLDRCFPDGAG